MVNTIQVSAKSWNAIPVDCWVFENKEYTLEEKADITLCGSRTRRHFEGVQYCVQKNQRE